MIRPARRPLRKNRLGLSLALAGASLPLIALPAQADDIDDSVFELGAIVVQGDRELVNERGERITRAKALRKFNKQTVGEAAAMSPGVNLSRNSRNEDTLYVRGFDSRQVPLFLDGIPQYVPYDGYVDFGRFSTFDLAEIRVAKGSASLLYGPNIMGGAVNLVSRKPERQLEGNVSIGAATGDERTVSANLGSNQGDWYIQAGASYLDADSFPLGKGFQDHKATPTDTGSKRENAWRTDRKGSIKLGFTPNATDEYALSYSRQDGRKGNPVYTGTSTRGIRYWQWPYWDKDSLYFLSSTALSEHYTLKTRWYRDTYGNKLEAFTDATYTQALNNKSFPSIYDDTIYGAALELVGRQWAAHELRLAVNYKDDRHDEYNPNSPTEQYRDVTQSTALEDLIELNSRWFLRLGASYEVRETRKADGWPAGTAYATNGLIELSHFLPNDLEIYASGAIKTRMPTIKDRYSARMGRALPNPDLQPEQAKHLELGLRGESWAGGRGEAAVFYSLIDDAIQTGLVDSTACGGTVCDQAQNIGRARHRGVELSLEQSLGSQWQTGFSYTFLDRDNLDNRDNLLTNTPRQRLFGHLSFQPVRQWQWQTSAEAEDGRYVNFAGSGGRTYRKLSGYAVFNSKLAWTPDNHWLVEAGVRNLADRNYELADGFPMPGRVWFSNASYRF